MALLGSEESGLGSVNTGAGSDDQGGGITRITSTDASVAVSDPTGPTVDLSVPAAQKPASAITGLTFPVLAGVPTLTAPGPGPVTFPGAVQVNGNFEALNGVLLQGASVVIDSPQISGTTTVNGSLDVSGGATTFHAGSPVTMDDNFEALNGALLQGTVVIDSPAISGTTTISGGLAISAAAATLNGEALAVVAGDDNTYAAPIATFPYNPAFGGGVRYFACDGGAGNDANAGFSDVSPAAAGAVAVKTLTRLLQILPTFGNGRACRVAIKAGVYNSSADTQITLSGFGFENASFNSLVIIGTATVPSAGSTAFLGDLNDSVCAGFQNATGMNAAGYNATAYATAGGIVTLTAQLAGGGAPAFPAMPARPYGCRIRFDVATTTAALRNQMSGVIRVDGSTGFVLSNPLPASPVAGDVFYIEMPGVSGPAQTLMAHFGDSSAGFQGTQVCGISFGSLQIVDSALSLTGCEATSVGLSNSNLTEADALLDNAAAGFDSRARGISLRCANKSTLSGINTVVAEVTTSTTTPGNAWKSTTSVLWERSASMTQPILYGTEQATGNNNLNTIGTNSSTAHGSPCQILGTCAAPAGTLRAGLVLYGSFTTARINFQNIGANPCVRLGGTALGVNVGAGLTGSTGNTDVGLDLSPAGVSGNSIGAMGCTVALTGTPTVTGTTGDVRLSDGTLVTWATVSAGIADPNGNRLFGVGNAPDHPIPVATGAGVLTVTNAPAGATAYARYFKIPDGAGGFLTIGSLT